MAEPFVEMLRGATNTLGRTEEVVEIVIAAPERLDELFELYFQPDEWVRLRVSSSLKRIWRHDPVWVAPYVERWTNEVARIDQPSVQWTFAQLLDECPQLFDEAQRTAAIAHVLGYLEHSDDWMVLNSSIESLVPFARDDESLRTKVVPLIEREVPARGPPWRSGPARPWCSSTLERELSGRIEWTPDPTWLTQRPLDHAGWRRPCPTQPRLVSSRQMSATSGDPRGRRARPNGNRADQRARVRRWLPQ